MTHEERFGLAVTQAWKGTLEFSQLISTATELEAAGQAHLAAVLYQTWLARNPSPFAYAGYFNAALSLANAGDLAAAEVCYRKAIEIHPAFVQPRLNLGMLYERQGQVDRALEELRWVEQNVSAATPENAGFVVMALNHLGRLQESRKDMEKATAYLTRSLALDPNQPDAPAPLGTPAAKAVPVAGVCAAAGREPASHARRHLGPGHAQRVR